MPTSKDIEKPAPALEPKNLRDAVRCFFDGRIITLMKIRFTTLKELFSKMLKGQQ